MNNLKELRTWVNTIISINVDNTNIDILKNFIKFSPEKFADKISINRKELVDEFTEYKKIAHNKINIYKKSLSLKLNDPEIFGFNYDNNFVTTTKCICIQYLTIRYKGVNFKFYPDVKYLYYDTSNNIIIFPMYEKIKRIHMTYDEFNNKFKDIREYKLSKLLD